MKIAGRIVLYLLLLIVVGGNLTSAFAQEQSCKCGTGCGCKKDSPSATCTCGTAHSMMMSHDHENVFLKMMDTMMMAMDAAPLDVSPEGNFLRQMIPHHEGAIEMAKYEISNGKDPQMIQLAKSILAEQQGEIAEMQTLLLLYPFKADKQAPTAYKAAMSATMDTMMGATPTDSLLSGKNVDCAFALVMLPHHQAAVDMATALLRFNPQGQVANYALRIISDQQIEIEQMASFIHKHCK